MASAFAIDDETGDLVRTGGKFVRATGADYMKQTTRCDLRFFRGEYRLDVNGVGVPWFQSILGKKTAALPAIRDILRSEVLKRSYVARIDAFVLAVDAERQLQVAMQLTSVDKLVVPDTFEVP